MNECDDKSPNLNVSNAYFPMPFSFPHKELIPGDIRGKQRDMSIKMKEQKEVIYRQQESECDLAL